MEEDDIHDDLQELIPLCKVKRQMLSWQKDENLYSRVPVALGYNNTTQILSIKNSLSLLTLLLSVATGSFSPIHCMHGKYILSICLLTIRTISYLVEMFHAAKEWLDANTNMFVVGGFLSPSHDQYVESKLGSEHIPAVHRYVSSRVTSRLIYIGE